MQRENLAFLRLQQQIDKENSREGKKFAYR